MKDDKIYRSIVFKLISAVVIIFIFMITITNYMINQKQNQMTEEMLLQINKWVPSYKNSVVVTVNNAHLQSTADFRIFTFVVMGMVLVIGSFIFALIISKILAPLKDLQKNIAKIDIERPETFAENQLVESGSSEIEDLAHSFNNLMDRIYRDYKKQKDFSSNVAHELRTPVAVMKAQVDVYRRKNQDPETAIFIQKIDENLSKLKNLIDSVLMFSQNQRINRTKVYIRDVFDEILFDLEDKIKAKDLDIKIDVDEELTLTTDDALFQRLMFNIIENSIKYNKDSGFVEIEAFNEDNKTIISIADNGVGISPDNKDKIFDLFYQEDQSRRVEGFGIGLSLSKQIAESLDARIRVLDNEPSGSKFLIMFDQS